MRVRAVGLNGADIMQLRGLYSAPPGVPADIPGLELAGEVVACGEGVLSHRPGERVMALLPGDAQAELAVVDERHALPVPDAVDWRQAGGFPELFITAHDALVTQCGLRRGERLLVSGAAGGVGTAAVQLGAALGARVTASVHNPALRDAVGALGAEAVRRVESEVLPLVRAGRVRVPVAHTFDLAAAAGAYARFQGGCKLGKIVLTVG